jgi:hypothetical protein
MTIHTLHPHLANGKRPTVATPILKNDTVAAALGSLDDHLRLLRCTADSAALVEETDGELVEALYFLHGKLKRECDKLFALL